jgi:hypothetical protein
MSGLALPWSIAVSFLVPEEWGQAHEWGFWTLLTLPALLNTSFLWFWALRRKR